MSISILLQRLITLLCTSHTGQCAPSLKWYKIHRVQPVPPAGGEGTVPGWAGTEQRNTLPGVLVPRGRGFGQGGRQEAAPASGSQELPSCASWAALPEGPRAGGALCQPRSHPSSLFLTSPSPWSVVPVLEQGKAPQPPGNADGWEREKICWNDALKKQRWRQEQQKVPLWLVFPTMIKTSISAPARAISGREFGRWGWQGLHPMSRAEQCCCCCQLPPSSLKYQGGTGQGLGCRAGEGWISKMYRFTSSIYNQ